MEKEMKADIQIYLNFIRGLGIKAWIPGTLGSGPKMSAIDQCRSGVLCLNYEGSDIYIQGISRRTKNDKSSTAGIVKNLYHVKSVKLENDALDRFDCGLDNTALNDNLGVNITKRDDEVKCRRDVGTQWSYKDIIDGSLEIPKFSKSITSHLKKSVGMKVDGIEQKSFSTDITGVAYKRIVEEKLTREVRVAKCYVSSLPNCILKRGSGGATKKKNGHLDKKSLRSDYTGKLWRSLDNTRLDEIKKSGLSPGFVRQLIKRFDVYDNVEQQRPSRRLL